MFPGSSRLRILANVSTHLGPSSGMRKNKIKGLAEIVRKYLRPRAPLRVFANAVPPSLLVTLEVELGTPRANITAFLGETTGMCVPSTTPFDFLINGSHRTFDLFIYYAETPAEILDVGAVLAARELLAERSVVHLQTSIRSDLRCRLPFVSKLREYTSLEPQDFDDVVSFEKLLSAFRGGLIDAVDNPDDVDYSSVPDLLSAGVAHVFQQGRLNFQEPCWLAKHPFHREVRRDVDRVLAAGTVPEFVTALFDIPHNVDDILASGRYSKTWLDGNLGGIASNIVRKLGRRTGRASTGPVYEPDTRLAMKLPRVLQSQRHDSADPNLGLLARHLAMLAHEEERRGYWTTNLTRIGVHNGNGDVVADTFCLEHCGGFLSSRPLLETVDGHVLPRLDDADPEQYLNRAFRTANEFMERYPPVMIRPRLDDPALTARRFDNGYLPPRVQAEKAVVDHLRGLGFTRTELDEYFETPVRRFSESASGVDRAG